MGEIAEDILDGVCCAICGCYFENLEKRGYAYEHGYPVACKDCHTEDCGYEKAVVNTF